MEEIWKDIKGYEGKYQISNMGNVKSLHYKKSLSERPRLLKQRCSIRNGKRCYMYVVLSKENKVHTFYVHRLVAVYFIPNPGNKPYINHIDGDKTNNIASNLEWVTPLENNLHAYHVLGKHPFKGIMFDKNKNSKKVNQYYISEEGYKYHIATYCSAKAASMINKLCQRSIMYCCNGNKEYKQVGGYIWEYEL